MKSTWRKTLGRIVVLVALYVLIGNARSIQENPFLPGATIAVYMVVPVIAGILCGPRVGLLVGLLGTLSNAGAYHYRDLGDRTIYELLAVIPHGIMGLAAGLLRGRIPTPFIALTIIIGHLLNIAAFLIAGKMTFSTISTQDFWLGLGYETAIGCITIIVMVTVYRIGFPERST